MKEIGLGGFLNIEFEKLVECLKPIGGEVRKVNLGGCLCGWGRSR